MSQTASSDGDVDARGTWAFIRSLPRQTRLYMIAAAVSSVGSTGMILARTTIAADAAPTVRAAANYASIMFFVGFGFAALAMPYTAVITRRLGVLGAFGAVQLLSCVGSLLTAGLIAVGLPGYPVLLCTAPLLGIAGGWGLTLNQIALASYAPEVGRARSIALVGSATGIGAIIGGPVGGLIIDVAGPLWVIVFNGLSFLPVVAIAWRLKPLRTPKTPTLQEKPWRSVLAATRSKSAIKGAVVVAASSALLIGPLSQMMVPLTRDLGHNMALHAGILIGALAAGSMVAPVLLPRLQHSIRAISTAKAYLIAAGAMVALAIFAIVLDGGPELVALTVIFVVFSAGSQTGRSYLVDYVQIESAEEERTRNLSTYFLAVMIGSTLGSLIWGLLLGSAGSIVTLLVLSAGLFLLMVFYWRNLVQAVAKVDEAAGDGRLPSQSGQNAGESAAQGK